MAADPSLLVDGAFWRRPLADRMQVFAEWRAEGPFVPAHVEVPFFGQSVDFTAVIGHPEVAEISRRPQEFCSGRGSTAIVDLPVDALEYFSSIIVMDDPRHARQRGIVARKFTPRHLQTLLDSVERVCTEVLDGVCEQGEVDLVETVAEPFPLLIICDMLGIPRSEFATVLRCTNVILGAGDLEATGSEDVFSALLSAGMELTGLLNELVEHRRQHPADDLTSALVHTDVGEDWLRPEELAPFFILLTTAGNDTTRNAISHGVDLLARHPDQKAAWQADPGGVTASAVEEILRLASPVVYMRRTATRDTTLAGVDVREGDKLAMFYGAANRDPRVFADPEAMDVRRSPNPHLAFGGPGPHFCLGAHLARRELAVMFRQLLTRLPDLEPAGEPQLLESQSIPLVGGVKHLPVRFTPAPRAGAA
ncbi:MAG TPA: cytochrome P450 [Acidimicrobiales bacterium]|nr:cytochrome P450 [Acidimicrobiales bacterium]